MKREKLLIPGPVEVSKQVRQELAKPILFHRSEEFGKIYKNCQDKAFKAFNVKSSDFSVLLIPSNGTQALETSLISLFDSNDRILILINGYFAHRIEEMAILSGLNISVLNLDWNKKIDPKKVEKAINSIKPSVMICVSLETSMGIFNPVKELGLLAKKYNLIFFVDAVSGYFGEDIDIERDNISLCVTVSNKALEAPPGLSIICLRKSLLTRIRKDNIPMSLDINRINKSAQKYQTPFTPNIPIFYAANKTLELFLAEGQKARSGRYFNLSESVRKTLSKNKLDFLTTTDNFANSITSIVFEKEREALKLQTYLKKNGFVVWLKNYEKINPKIKNVLQFSVMGDLSKSDIIKLNQLLDRYYEKQR